MHHRALNYAFVAAVVTALAPAAPQAHAAVSFDWATIGNAGNAPDPLTGFGAVSYEYRIATTEVTNAQYAQFLNTVATSDPNNLYNSGMAGAFGGITRSGTPGAFVYSLVPGRDNHPVNFVSFLDAMRFTNWLHNGQGQGDTETGVYTLAGPVTAFALPRPANARYFVPTFDEWYKAAFHQPAGLGGDADDFWLYPTSSNTAPVAGVDANFATVVGDALPVAGFAPNFYGLFDIGGNIAEKGIDPLGLASGLVLGGRWDGLTFQLESTNLIGSVQGGFSNFETELDGFRVASTVPEPASALLLVLTAPLLMRRRRG